MVFLVKISQTTVSATSQFFKASQIGFEQAFNNLTFKHIDALRKQN